MSLHDLQWELNILMCAHTLLFFFSPWECTSFASTVNSCVETPVSLRAFVRPSRLGEVIHHSKHQMTSPPTPILQLLPFHPPHTLHSKGLAGFHHAPSSPPPSSSSSVPHVLHLTELRFCGESAESSLLASLYTRLTWVRCRVCSCAPVHVYFSIWGGGFVINTVSPLSPYTLVRL